MDTVGGDARMITWDDVAVEPPPPGPHDWNAEGVVILPRLLGPGMIDAYMNAWQDAHGHDWPPRTPGGWTHPTPYMECDELRELFTLSRVQDAVEELIGEPPGLHLCLTGWVSTRRDWHQDTYLNPDHVGDSYAAVWLALEDVHPDAGPFQYVPGSHRWPTITRDKIARFVNIGDPLWPAHTEEFLSPFIEAEIARLRRPLYDGTAGDYHTDPVVTYLPKRGDVLIWHGRLMHRGSVPNDPTLPRRAVIAHMSGIYHRPDMPAPARDPITRGWYFPIVTCGDDTVQKDEVRAMRR